MSKLIDLLVIEGMDETYAAICPFGVAAVGDVVTITDYDGVFFVTAHVCGVEEGDAKNLATALAGDAYPVEAVYQKGWCRNEPDA